MGFEDMKNDLITKKEDLESSNSKPEKALKIGAIKLEGNEKYKTKIASYHLTVDSINWINKKAKELNIGKSELVQRIIDEIISQNEN